MIFLTPRQKSKDRRDLIFNCRSTYCSKRDRFTYLFGYIPVGWGDSIELLEMEKEPETKSTSSIAHVSSLSQRKMIEVSDVSGILNDPLKAGC